MVTDLSGGQIVKCQYSEAFRAPTLYEMHTQNNQFWVESGVKPEKGKLYEASWIYRNQRGERASVTLFRNELSNFVILDVANQRVTNTKGHFQGVEAEYQRAFGPRFKTVLNATFMETYDEQLDDSFPGTPHVMGNLIGIVQMPYHTKAAVLYHYDGEQTHADDPDRKMDPLHHVNVTFKWEKTQRLDFTLALQNLLSEEAKVVSSEEAYPDDLLLVDTPSVEFKAHYRF